MLKENNLTQKLIRPHMSEQNVIVERANKTIRESLATVILTDYEQAKQEISKIIYYYTNKRRHSSLHYLTPAQYYRGDPDILLAVREAKIEKARILRKGGNMEKRNGGEMAGTVSSLSPRFVQKCEKHYSSDTPYSSPTRRYLHLRS